MNLPNGYTLKRVHLHNGNSSRSQRHGHPYVTISRIYDVHGKEVAKGKAMCSRQDKPSRAVGRTLADSRAIAQVI